jgi:hypothetical protein
MMILVRSAVSVALPGLVIVPRLLLLDQVGGGVDRGRCRDRGWRLRAEPANSGTDNDALVLRTVVRCAGQPVEDGKDRLVSVAR